MMVLNFGGSIISYFEVSNNMTLTL